MDNLTVQAGIARETEDLTGVPCSVKVVFRESRTGRSYIVTTEAGEGYLPPFLQRRQKFCAVDVSAEPEHIYRFSRIFKTLDQKHEFTLAFRLKCGVVDPRRLAEGLVMDPLRQLEAHAEVEIGGQARRLPWSVLWDGGDEFQRSLREITDQQSGAVKEAREILDHTAGGWGLRILGCVVERILPPDAVAPEGYDTIEGDIERRRKMADIENEFIVESFRKDRSQGLATQSTGYDNELKVLSTQGKLVDELQKVIERVGARVESVPQLARTLNDLRNLRGDLQMLVAPSSAGIGIIESSTSTDSAPRYLEAGSGNGSGLTEVLGEAQHHLGNLPEGLQQSMGAISLRLMAAELDGCSGQEANDLREQLEELLSCELDALRDEQVTFFRLLVGRQWIRECLEAK